MNRNIVEFCCMNDDCPVAQEDAKIVDEDTGEVEFDDSSRHTWFGDYHEATRIDTAYYAGDECKHCGQSGEEIGRYTARELREEMDPRL